MTEQQDNAALEREEIASRVANFKATQEKFEREREEYFVTTLENARHSFERPPFWPSGRANARPRSTPISKTKSPKRCFGLFDINYQ